MNWTDILNALPEIGGILGGGALSGLLGWKLAKRKNTAEVTGLEIKNESDIVATYTKLLENATTHYTQLLDETVKRMNEARQEDKKEIESLKKEVESLHKKLNDVMEENNRLNLFVNEAFKCKYDFRECPVIRLKQEMTKKAISEKS